MKQIIIYSTILLLFGCFPFGEWSENITGKYNLIYIDDCKNMYVCVEYENDKFVGVVGPTVFAVGFNEDFIIVKQHPSKFSEPIIDKSVTNYYIIPLKESVSKSLDLNKIGPLTKEGFFKKRKELGIPDNLTFTKVFKNLE